MKGNKNPESLSVELALKKLGEVGRYEAEEMMEIQERVNALRVSRQEAEGAFNKALMEEAQKNKKPVEPDTPLN